MRRLTLAGAAAALLLVAVVSTVAAAGPQGFGDPQAADRTAARADVIADILGLGRDAIADLRQDGLSLAQIAERQKVDPQKLVDALVAQWTARIEARVQAGALTADQATALKTQLATRARDMVYRVTPGGMRGAAVGAGPANSAGVRAGANGSGAGAGGRGRGAGAGVCDGSGRAASTP